MTHLQNRSVNDRSNVRALFLRIFTREKRFYLLGGIVGYDETWKDAHAQHQCQKQQRYRKCSAHPTARMPVIQILGGVLKTKSNRSIYTFHISFLSLLLSIEIISLLFII
jgi:hypothetical protein